MAANRTDRRNKDTGPANRRRTKLADDFACEIFEMLAHEAHYELKANHKPSNPYQLAKWLNEKQIKTRHGSVWDKRAVQRISKRYKKLKRP